jgi:uroporphyrinogen decarboxylase
MRERILRALRGQPVDTTPIWLMRQAGRYLPGYRALRAKHSILEIARTPELAVEATLEPVRRYDVDAGVVFADITLPLAGLGVEFRIDPGRGPVVPHPIRTDADIARMTPFDASAVAFVGEAIRGFRAEETERPILGFAGAPFTLAAYLIEGGASKEFPETRRLLYEDPERFGRLLEPLTQMTIRYLKEQAKAGAAALQLFDTWAGILPLPEFTRLVRPHLRRIFDALKGEGVPTIYFSTTSAHLLPAIRGIGSDAVGVDWRLPLGAVRAQLPGVALQGNLDPGALLGSPEALAHSARAVLAELPDRTGHVFNLGHGVLPETPVEAVKALVELVHAEGRRPAPP